MSLLLLLLVFGSRKLQDLILPVILLNVSTWLLARFCDGIIMFYEADILTVYLFVWQLSFIIYQWIHQDLPYLSYGLHQIVSCLYVAFLSFMVYDVLLRYLGTFFNFTFIWVASIFDMWVCINVSLSSLEKYHRKCSTSVWYIIRMIIVISHRRTKSIYIWRAFETFE